MWEITRCLLPKKGLFFLRWHQGRCFESQHSFPLKKHHKNWWIGKNGIKCPFHFSSNSRLWDYAMPSTQKKDFFFLKMAPRPSFWKSTQFSSAGTCIEKVHLNAKPQNFFWNKNQSLVILQIYICFAFKKSHQKKFYALMPVRKLLVWLSATYSKVAFALNRLFCSVFCASIEEFEFPYR